MATERFVQIQPMEGTFSARTSFVRKVIVAASGGKTCGVDVGSTTCKFVLVSPDGQLLGQAYERHNTKQAEKVLEFLTRLELEHNFTPQQDRIFFTGSGSGIIAPLVGGKIIQEVVAVAAAVEKLHPSVRFVSEIGGENG